MTRRLLLAVLSLTSALLTGQTHTVRGTITTSGQQTIPYANVWLEPLGRGTSADVDGRFSLADVPEGKYLLRVSAVGYAPTQDSLTVAANAAPLTLHLRSGANLQEVEVFGSRYGHPDKIEALTRLPLETYEQIQTISVISEKVIEQQGALTIADATRNVPGVYTFATYGGRTESMSARGFRGIPMLKNGVRVHSDFRGQGFLTDMQGVDNIQVLKGAAAITQGVATDLGSPGGVINIVTKTPQYVPGGQVSLRAGSFGQARLTFDTYGPLNEDKTLAFRVNGAVERADGYRTGLSSQRFYVNPSAEYKLDARSTLTLELEYFDDSRTPDLGTVNLAENDINAIYDLPTDRFLGYANDRNVLRTLNYSARFRRELSDQLSLRAAWYRSKYNSDNKGASLGDALDVAGEVRYNLRGRGYSTSTRDDRNSVLQLDLIGTELRTGRLLHTFQIGTDYRTADFSTASRSASGLDTIDVFGAVNNQLPDGLALGGPRTGGSESRSIGVVAQDVITINGWLKTFLGARYSVTESITEDETTHRGALNPLAGVIVTPIEQVNLFASYTNSSYPRTATRLDADGRELGNERFDQLEAGVKTHFRDGRFRANLTLYRINNRNINLPVYDENWVATGFYAKGGNDQRQGIELELTGRLTRQLEVIAGYAYLDAQYLEHTSFVYGSAPLNTPKHTLNVYANYDLAPLVEGLTVGGGIYYTGARPINDWSAGPVTHEGIVPNQEPFNVAAYTTVNAQIGYRLNDHWQARVLLNNLTNTIGYNAYRTRYINQTDPRNFAAVVSYRF
ncbi:TonB-dependent receptor [Lewinella sp. IMCC34183]|uniref:TonB-dependent receptor n=1 Tax=Lewinella sp. IMCC34183 TaxID=2248762 RepID=UPI000E21D8A7|nr:TonB-dependent receptor [Lewinella sp. IMCC34183]